MIEALERDPDRQGWVVQFLLENTDSLERRAALAQQLFLELSPKAWSRAPGALRRGIYDALCDEAIACTPPRLPPNPRRRRR